MYSSRWKIYETLLRPEVENIIYLTRLYLTHDNEGPTRGRKRSFDNRYEDAITFASKELAARRCCEVGAKETTEGGVSKNPGETLSHGVRFFARGRSRRIFTRRKIEALHRDIYSARASLSDRLPSPGMNVDPDRALVERKSQLSFPKCYRSFVIAFDFFLFFCFVFSCSHRVLLCTNKSYLVLFFITR